MGYQPIAPLPPCLSSLERFERELRRDRGSDVVTEWLNAIGVALVFALLISVSVLAWMLA